VIEAVMVWNEPNNASHWDFGLDPEWRIFAEMARKAGAAIRAENADVVRVLGGISPIDPNFVERMGKLGVLEAMDVVAVHGFPLDWNLWSMHEWPCKIEMLRRKTRHPVWITEVGVSSFASERVQAHGLPRIAELLLGRSERIHWYSLFDLPGDWEATTRHRQREGSSYFRHFHMGLVRQDGTPKPALAAFAEYAPELGICQWFHFDDPRLDDAVRWLRRMGVKKVRTGLSWSDDVRPDALRWFDRQMRALEDFDVTLTYCFTPECKGIAPHYTSPPADVGEFADFCARMTRRYAGG
jgi:beta-xylosidase